jgi:hypothetical protein
MKSVGRLFYVLVGILLISPVLLAQISPAGMSLADSPDIPFYWVEISDGTVRGTAPDDDVLYPVSIPFSFRYYNQPYSTVYVSSNGYLTFNNYGTADPYPVNDNLSTNTPPDRMLAVFWDDLILNGSSARIYSKVVGSSPYRKLIVEYKDVELKAGSFPLTFQVILHETTNLIEFQYLNLGSGTSAELGGGATVGVKYFPDRLVYSFDNPSLSENLAILFFPYASLAANSSIQPTQTSAGTNGQNFRLSITNLTTGAIQLQPMGKADVLRIKNPLSNPVAAVDSITVDGTDFFFIQRNTPPTASEYMTLPTIATWYFDSGKDSLYIQLPPYTAKTQLSISFRMNISNDPLGGYDFNSNIYPRLNFANAASLTPGTVTLAAGNVAYYTLVPQTATITAGGSIQFTVTARDQFGNPVANDDSVSISVLGSTTAVYPSKGYFNNNSSFIFVVTETQSGNFVAKVVNLDNSALSVQSGIITVNPGVPTTITKVSGDSNGIIAGANQILRARVTDINGNAVNGVLVEFLIVSGGGNFSGFTTQTVSTGTDGIAQATLTTGKTVGTNLANARIVSSPGVSTQFTVTTVPGPIGYYTVTPATFNATVGTDISVAVAAFDVNNNAVTTDSSTVVEFLSDGTGINIAPLSATLVAGTTSFTVGNTVAETFRVQARSQLDPSKTGFSNPITTTAGTPTALAKNAGDGQTAPVNSLLPLNLEVRVLDQFSNPVSGVTVTFDPIGGGTATNPNAVTNSQGIASSGWTVHSTATPDIMAAYVAGQTTTPDTLYFTANVTAGTGVVMTQQPPASSTGVVDDFLPDNFRVRITDSGGNAVPNFQVSFAIVSKPAGAVNDSLTVYSGTTNALGEVETNLHLGTKVGTYKVRAYASSTTPNFVDFTATAIHREPDRILVASGNNQSGTVGQALTNPVAFQLVDIYDNPIADSTLNFTALPTFGTVNPVSAITNASGQAATTWTLGQPVGLQKMVANFTPLGITSDTAYATAQAAVGAFLELVSMRQIPRDSIAAVRGENITVVVQARDSFGNPAPNTIIGFESLPGFNALFESAQVTTDAQGRAVNIVTTDQANDSTFFRVVIGSSDILNLHIFHIRYAGNLSPTTVASGETAAFSLDIENFSPNPVTLNPSATHFRFSDGTNLFDATLNTPAILQPGITNITFNSSIVDTNFANVSYAPEVYLRGSGENALLGGSIFLPNNSLSIFTVKVSRILGSKTLVTQGDTVTITMRVRKSGPVTVNVNNVTLSITGTPQIPQANITPSPGNPTQLAPGISVHDFEFVIIVPQNANSFYIVDGQFQGTTLSGVAVNDSGADTTFTFNVSVKANLGLQSISPAVVTAGEPVTFTAVLFNDGAVDALLDPNFTYLKFGQDSVLLKQSYSVPTGGTANPVEVEFVSPSILSPAQAARHLMDLRLFGTQGGINFDTTLVAADSILVQNSPNVTVSLINVLPDTVSQNQDSVRAQVQLTNGGAFNAPARISLPSGVTLSALGLDSIPAFGSGTFTLNAGQTSAPINFLYNLSQTYPPGNDRAKVRYRFTDVNSGRIFTAAPPDSDQFVVLSRARLSLQGHSLVPDTVSSGQSGVEFRFTARNDGQSLAAIDSSDISIQFNNTHTINLISPAPATLPVVLEENAAREFIYSLSINPGSSIGPDPLDLTVSHTDTFSGKRYTDVVASNLDTLLIVQGTGAADVQIQTIKVTPAIANQGQSGMLAKVRVKNLAQSAVRIDSLYLIYSRPGLSDSLLTPLPAQGQIAAGDTASIQFTISADGSMSPGAVTIDAGYRATELLSGATFSDSGAVAPGTLTILTPANFTFSPVILVPDTATQGQSGIIATTIITNGDATTSPARVTGLEALFSIGGVVTGTLINPLSLPVLLPGGEALQVQFRLSVAGIATPGSVGVQIAADALDLTDGTTFSDASLAAVLTIQQRANLEIVSLVIPPDSAYLGQTQIPVNITVQNNGSGEAQLNKVNLVLHNAPNFPKSLLTFTLPEILNQGQQKEINYQISIPSNINLPGGDSLIYAGASIEGIEISSGAALFNSADSLDNLLIAEPPDTRFDGILSSTVWNLGDTANFVLQVTNTGGTNLALNNTTFIRLEQVNNPNNFFIRSINPVSSDMNILAGETTQLTFRDTLLSNAGDYRFFLGVRGSIYQPPNLLAFSQDILTQAFLNVGGNISIQLVQVIPDVVQAGDPGIQLNAIVANNTLPVTIDPGWTLEFRYTDNADPLSIVPIRIDTLTQVGTTPLPDTLKWLFNVPPAARAGEVGVTVTLTFNNGAITPAPRTGLFDIKSGADLEYVASSLIPAAVVPGEKVSFSAKFINAGSENFFVTSDSSYVEFSDVSLNTFKSFVNGNFVVRGTDFGQEPDTSEIAFRLDSLPSQFLTGTYDVSFHIFGELPNADTLTTLDTTFSNQLTVLQEALVTLDSIDVVPSAIIAGQQNVEVRYLIRNNGVSPATVQSASSLFTDSLGTDISALWTLQSQSQTFPFTLGASAAATLTRTFIVSQNIDSGLVRGRLRVNYIDVRKPQTPLIADDPAVYDSVRVINPSRIYVNGLELVNVPNAANQTVNYIQPYELQLTVQNSGQDTLTNIVLRFFNDATQSTVLTDTITGTVLGPGMQSQKLYSFVAGSISETVRYRAVILQAVSVISGTPVQIGEPLDNREDVIVQQPIRLTLNAEASGDSAYSQGQDFTISFDINTLGQSPFGSGQVRIELPPDYNLVSPGSQVPIGPTNLSGSWQVTASPDTTVGNADTIRVSYVTIPPDLNTNTPVITTNDNVNVPVRVVEGGSVKVAAINIVSPPGALDSIISSGQRFRLSANIQYSGIVAANGRTARIILPAGFSTNPDSIEQTIQQASATVFWDITVSENILQTLAGNAPGGRNKLAQTSSSRNGRGTSGEGTALNRETGARRPGALENLLAEIFQLEVIAKGFDGGNTTQQFSHTRAKQVTVVERAKMMMHAAIVDPPGTLQGTVSTHLPFDVQIWVEKLGEAGIIGTDSNYVTVKVPQGFRIEGLATGDSLQNYPIKTGQAEADIIRIFAPATVPATQPLIQTRIDSTARDENTNAPAFIQQALASFNVAVERRAALRIDNLTAGVDSLAQDQMFTLQGLVSNAGSADVEPNNNVTVRLAFDTTAFRLLNPADTVKTVQLVNKTALVSWQMRTKPDANVNTNPYFITASIDSTLSWDEHGFTGMAVHLEKGEASDTLNIVSTGTFVISSAYLNTPNTDSLTVSTTQAVSAVVLPQIVGSFVNRIATLYLPEIFPADSMVAPISAGGSPVTFNIQIPDSVTGVWEQLRVKIQGTSQISGSITLSDTAYLYIFVQERATLVVSGQVVNGGLNNTVSQGSSFIYEAKVSNIGQAGVLGTPQGQLTLQVGDKLNVDPDSLVKNFDVGQSIRWTVDVEENVLASSLLRQIQSLENEKASLIVAEKRLAPTQGRQTATGRLTKASAEGTTGGFTRLRELEQLEGQISGLSEQLSAIMDTSFVKTTITGRPPDANAGTPAFVQTGSDSTTVFIAEKPTIEIITVTAPSAWSTEQQGIVEVNVEASGNVIERTGILRLPQGLSFVNPTDSLKTFTQNATVNWTIRADQTISAPSLSGTMTVIVRGRDENNPPPNTILVSDTTMIPVSVERKARLSLSSPSVSIRLLKSEAFTVEAIVTNLGTANVTGTGSLRLNIGDVGFEFAPGETAEKEITVDNATNTASAEWDVVAPEFDVNSTFGIGFIQLPLDVNTQDIASVGIDTLVLDVNMVSSQLVFKKLPEIQVENSYVQGETEIGVVGLGFRNPNTIEEIFMKSFTVGIVEGESDAPVTDIQNLISRLEVVSYDFYLRQIAKVNTPPDRLGEILIDAQTPNPFTLNFANVDTVSGEQTDSLVVLIDLANQPVNRNFKLQILNVDAAGLFVGKVNVVDSLGSPIEALEIQSPRITILSSDPEEIFRNYPNPFSMDTQLPGAPRGVTRFSFKMESSGDAQLQIFTLLGRLVHSTELKNVPEGLHNSLLNWNGTNDQGNRVVNGVYIAVLQVKYSNGTTKTYETKVAYIK